KHPMKRGSYEMDTGKIRKEVHILAGNDNKISALFEPADYTIGLAQRFKELLKKKPTSLKREETSEGIWYRETTIENK
ncbi:MAG: hypothetical protein WCL00_08235, partial [Bacteroidota bacterium]